MQSEQFDFRNSRGQTLRALLHEPAGDHVGYALFAHCFTCSKESRAARVIGESMAARGSVFCDSTSPAWVPAREISRTRISPPTSTISLPPPTTFG